MRLLVATLLLPAGMCLLGNAVPAQAQDAPPVETSDSSASDEPIAGQSPSETDTAGKSAPTPSPEDAAAPSPKPTPRDSRPRLLQAGARTGVSRYQPGVWGALAITVSNPTAEPVEVLVATYFEENPLLHYGRRLWIPAKSILESSFPILPPAHPKNRKRLEFRTLMQPLGSDNAPWTRADDGGRVNEGVLPLAESRTTTGVISDAYGDELRQSLTSTARVSRDLPKSLVGFHDRFLPATPELLQGLDQAVICTDRLNTDPAGTAALRRWIQSGGYAWIMLDQVQPETVAALLGDAFDTHIVDRISLNSVLMVGEQGRSKTPADPEPREFEDPIPFVRVIPGDVEVAYSVNGWPAAYWRSVGRGRVLVTTLGPRAWMRDRTRHDVARQDLNFETPFIVLTPMSILAAEFFENKPEIPLQVDELKTFLAEQIGYAILNRQQILGILGGLSLFLIVTGVVLTRSKRGEHLGWLAPCGAMATAGVLVWLGSQDRQQVPPTLATAQLINLVPGADDVNVSGLLAAFNADESTKQIGSESTGVFFPDMSGIEGKTRRMIWSDMDSWTWQQLRLPPGVRNAAFTYYGPLTSTPSAVAQFTSDGLLGKFETGGFQNVEDVVIALPKQRGLWAELQEDGTFRSGAAHVLARNQYIGDALLSDEQRRRQQIYQKMLTKNRGASFPTKPTLLAWADPLDLKFSFPDTTRQVGSALLTIPLTIEQTPPETRVSIPSAFLIFRSVGGPKSQSPSSAYSNRTGEWVKSRRAGRSHFRFQLPAEVLPIKLDRAQLNIQIDASSREVDINAVLGDQVTPIKRLQKTVGRITVDIDQADQLQLDEAGGLTIGIYVGIHALQSKEINEDQSSFWQFDGLQLEVSGVTLQE
ncbi:MAG: hypothetical protein ABGZ17_01430 [Planctomycetaceae bacterium]